MKNIDMNQTRLLILLWTSLCAFSSLFAQPHSCGDYTEVSKKISTLETEVHEARSNKAKYNSLLKKLIAESNGAAILLEDCFSSLHIDENSDKYLPTVYNLGYHYYFGSSIDKSRDYFTKCTVAKNSRHKTIGNVTYYEASINYLSQINRTSYYNDGRTVIMAGSTKGGLYRNMVTDVYARFISDKYDAQSPYLGFEFTQLQNRIFRSSDITKASKTLEIYSSNRNVEYTKPFLLVGATQDYVLDTSNFFTKNPRVGRNTGQKQDLKKIAQEIVVGTSMLLKKLYFDKVDSSEVIIPLYLFGGEFTEEGYLSFLEYCYKLHFRVPGPVVAYYNPVDRSIVAWVASGGGTINHELVHAMLAADYQAMPPYWLDEGIASLYEESTRKLQPLNNFRLSYIQATAKKFNRIASIREIVNATYDTANREYGKNLLDAYSRYLCKFFYEKKQLQLVYKTFRDKKVNSSTDPDRQIRELEAITNNDINQLQIEWESWLTNQKIPPKWSAYTWEIDEYVRFNIDTYPLKN